VTSPLITDLAASFRRFLRAAGKADRTITLYGMSIRMFVDWLEKQDRPATLDQFTRHAVAAWMADLMEVNEPSTAATRLRGLRRFARWLVTEGEIERAPTEGVEIPAPADKPVEILTDDELGRLIKACAVGKAKTGAFDAQVFEGRRDEVIVRVLADCGIRVSELAGADVEHADLDQEVLYVIGKGNRPRAVPFGARTAQAIDRYLRMRSSHPHAKRTERLLLTQRGPISADGIRWRLEVLGRAAGIEGLHPHAFRHTAAHQFLSAGGQERDLMHLMGWRSDAMLAVYARSTAVERAHAAHRRLGLGNRI
jgi:site-specific recombinase XerD